MDSQDISGLGPFYVKRARHGITRSGYYITILIHGPGVDSGRDDTIAVLDMERWCMRTEGIVIDLRDELVYCHWNPSL
jgi:hypothetical protein